MGNQEETEAIENKLNSIHNWKLVETHDDIPFDISGLFYSECEKQDHSLIHFLANDQFIYFFDNGEPKHLPFFLTKMEEAFYYDNHKNVYSLKLTSNKLETVLATTDREIFIKFYCHLAKYCILTHFDRHFTVGQKLGSGNYGTVYRGLNKLSNQEVALKVFNKKSIRASHSIKEVVQNQIYILEKLRRYNLSPLLEIFETDDCIILVLELAKCGDLLHYLINQETEINETFLKHAFCKILQSISALHKAGFIHRDIKPENVVVKRGNQHINLFLCDFSISLIKNDQHCDFLRSLRAGTPGFIAPEILKNNIFDEKCDLFSFGCLIYMLFSGQQLFGCIPDRQICILLEDNYFIQEKISRLAASKSLKKLLRHLLQVNPEKRMSAQEALKSQYFSQNQNETPCIIECDITFKQFIEKRISLYSASTKGETSF